MNEIKSLIFTFFFGFMSGRWRENALTKLEKKYICRPFGWKNVACHAWKRAGIPVAGNEKFKFDIYEESLVCGTCGVCSGCL
ncbi:hypothetical protein [Mediterranea massiliensis]|uniref:hypothetical protein n=1 Tax=Mediterranea massiliensis TaxID=1841865 RepID=UPI0025A3FEC6|nr:hypothetical protein [Mediterranea massiliensis]